jgi:hypothetical protein
MKQNLTEFDQTILTFFAAPAIVVVKLVQIVARWRFYKTAYTSRLFCANCGAAVWLVGLWRCPCGFTYKGHLLRICPVCESLPAMVRCYECGVTAKLPEP